MPFSFRVFIIIVVNIFMAPRHEQIILMKKKQNWHRNYKMKNKYDWCYNHYLYLLTVFRNEKPKTYKKILTLISLRCQNNN